MEFTDSYFLATVSASLVILIVISWRLFVAKKKIKQLQTQLKESGERYANYFHRTEQLRKYQAIPDAEEAAQRIMIQAQELHEKVRADYDRQLAEAAKLGKQEANSMLQQAQRISEQAKQEAEFIRNQARSEYDKQIAEAKSLAQTELNESKEKAKELKAQAEQRLQEANLVANKIETDARRKAEEIAGDALQAKQNADRYEAAIKAMKNVINGYGDEYLIPNQNVLDELADEYSHKDAGQELARVREVIKQMIKHGNASLCDYAEPNRRADAMRFVLDAFNGKVDTIMAKVKHDNYGLLLQQLKDAFSLVNHNGAAFRNARISSRYLDVVLEQLKWAVAVQELKRQDQEEQRRIREQMREEERAQREYEKALKEAEKEEKMLQKAMREAEQKLATAAAEERSTWEAKLADLHAKLAEAEARSQRALSMAQQTKQGHVYVISNIGSFGEHVFKIGMTRRLEPMERITELGDASVPFSFDVHAMIFSEDAPTLEKNLHKFFEEHQMNKVNPRKEFFKLPIHDIKDKVEGIGINVHWTMKAEALEYRESLQIEQRNAQALLAANLVAPL